MQPPFVVQEISLARLQAKGLLVAKSCCLEVGQVRLDHGAPSGESIEPQPYGHPSATVRAEDLGGMSVSGAEVRRPREGQGISGFTTFVMQQVGVHATSVGEQAFASSAGGLGADQQHQTRRMGKAGPFRMRVELSVSEPGEPGPTGVTGDAANRGQPIGVAVAVRGDGHDAGGEGPYGVASGEPGDSDQTVLAQLLGDLGRCARRFVIEEVRCKQITGSHRRTPSSAVSGFTVEIGGAEGKATDCRLRQIAQKQGALNAPCYGPNTPALPCTARKLMTYTPPTWPVSVKGVALDARGRVLLLKNEREEWELPGGRLEAADISPERTVERELQEESGWTVKAGPLLDTWIYQPLPQTRPERRVVIITYGCTVLTPEVDPVLSHEHKQIGLFTAAEVPGLTMPEGYKQSIATWYGRM
nr:NUDIX hydrolase [Streptomyces platensis]